MNTYKLRYQATIERFSFACRVRDNIQAAHQIARNAHNTL
jgi:hypothetical protein